MINWNDKFIKLHILLILIIGEFDGMAMTILLIQFLFLCWNLGTHLFLTCLICFLNFFGEKEHQLFFFFNWIFIMNSVLSSSAHLFGPLKITHIIIFIKIKENWLFVSILKWSVVEFEKFSENERWACVTLLKYVAFWEC